MSEKIPVSEYLKHIKNKNTDVDIDETKKNDFKLVKAGLQGNIAKWILILLGASLGFGALLLLLLLYVPVDAARVETSMDAVLEFLGSTFSIIVPSAFLVIGYFLRQE